MGKLNKLKIYAYSNDTFRSEVGNYTVNINPESYSYNHAVKFSDTKNVAEGAGNSGKFNSVDKETVGFSIYFDGTGIFKEKGSVNDQIIKFKKLVYQYNGKIHRTNYIKLSWGTLVFYCYLTKLDISYTLFKDNGNPLRAKADVSFSGFSNSKLLAASANKQSPDVNHLKVVKIHNTIPLFCNEIYDDSSLYIQIAEANKLDSFRNVPIGTKLLFPPLKK
ncbi:CIS tube protein [Lacinutrix chionoecetis]